ncbi:hypothetical protein [Tateyamaria omphalii]|uniref:hypothetical protein n=1 Tax=Tateyamaria omphalii TaxID=299262 RepID=UPI001678BC5A|nr:hypothetical protein [Tateyamaria omphalii]
MIFGFSNVASGAGFTTPLTEILSDTHPEVEVCRVGLGALQLHIVPAFLRSALEAEGPVTHVLLEIASSAFALHPLASDALTREFLLDTVRAVQEHDAQPLFMLHYRDMRDRMAHDVVASARSFCQERNLACLDLADALLDEMGKEALHGLLKDEAHTTPDGSQLFAERTHAFLAPFLGEPEKVVGTFQPQWVRRCVHLREVLPTHELEPLEHFGLHQEYLELSPETHIELRFKDRQRVLGCSFLYHSGGGHVGIRCDDDASATSFAAIDPFSYVTRIGIHALKHYEGRDVERIEIGPTKPAEDVVLLKDRSKTSLKTLLGSVLVMDPFPKPN